MDGVINDQAFGPPLVPPVAPGTQPRRHHDRKGCDTDLAVLSQRPGRLVSIVNRPLGVR